MDKIYIKDYSEVLGSRTGEKSAQGCFQTWMKVYIDKAIEDNRKIIINLDGTYGLCHAFIDELAKQIEETYTEEILKNFVEFENNENNSPFMKNRLLSLVK